MPSTILVTSLHNSGPGTLRAAIEKADLNHEGADTIKFAHSVRGSIPLTSALPSLSTDIVISGPGPSGADGGPQLRPGDARVPHLHGSERCQGLDHRFDHRERERPDGGGIDNAGSLSLINTTISGNSVTGGANVTPDSANGGNGDGGGIDNSGKLSVTDSTFSGNSATGGINETGGFGYGGGIANSGTLSVTDSTFSGNSANGGGGHYAGSAGGGGIENSGTLSVTDSTFSGNSATGGTSNSGGDGNGGGIDNSGTLSVTESTFSGNSATGGFGVVHRFRQRRRRRNQQLGHALGHRLHLQRQRHDGIPYWRLCVWGRDQQLRHGSPSATPRSAATRPRRFSVVSAAASQTPAVRQSPTPRSAATRPRAALANSPATAMAAESTTPARSRSPTPHSAAIRRQAITPVSAAGSPTRAQLSLTYVTADDNSAATGGGVAIVSGAQSVVDSIDSIFQNAQGGNVAVAAGSFDSLGHNLFSDTPSVSLEATDLVNTDPLLGPLANNGGPTLTQALLAGSPAINAGIPVAGITTDQRGGSRPSSGATDIGAFQIQPPLTVVSLRRSGTGHHPTELVLTFNLPLDACRPNPSPTTSSSRSTTAAVIVIRSAQYNAASQSVTLRPKTRLLPSQTYSLTVIGTPPAGLTTSVGAYLAGAGQPGTNYVATIT